jgi:hypothetical protein
MTSPAISANRDACVRPYATGVNHVAFPASAPRADQFQ